MELSSDQCLCCVADGEDGAEQGHRILNIVHEKMQQSPGLAPPPAERGQRSGASRCCDRNPRHKLIKPLTPAGVVGGGMSRDCRRRRLLADGCPQSLSFRWEVVSYWTKTMSTSLGHHPSGGPENTHRPRRSTHTVENDCRRQTKQ